jgi:hypothetical protein
MSGNRSGATTYASQITPRYIWQAAIDGRAQYSQPTMREGEYSRRFADGGQMYTAGPVRPVYQAQWAHQFEAKADVHRRFSASDDWTAHDFLDHAARYAAPCVIKDATEAMVFYCGTGFDRGSRARARPTP